MRKPAFCIFLWPLYFDIIFLLTITVRGYQISIAYCLFFHLCRNACFTSSKHLLPLKILGGTSGLINNHVQTGTKYTVLHISLHYFLR